MLHVCQFPQWKNKVKYKAAHLQTFALNSFFGSSVAMMLARNIDNALLQLRQKSIFPHSMPNRLE